MEHFKLGTSLQLKNIKMVPPLLLHSVSVSFHYDPNQFLEIFFACGAVFTPNMLILIYKYYKSGGIIKF